ncbi:MAG TPA: hypothetical protein VF438_01990 [Candidatus Paceibacterota bacterium]
MNYLKTSLIGFTSLAAVLGGTALANAQVMGSSVTAYGNGNGGAIVVPNDPSSVTAIGDSGTYVYLMSPSALNASQLAVSNAIPANYRPGFYNYPGYIATTSPAIAINGSWINGTWVPSTTYPGVPNTGGSIVTSNTANVYTTANPATGTYIAPMTSWNGMGITGGVSIPVGYSPAIGVNGSILTTSNWTNTTTTNGTWINGVWTPSNSIPGVPNTGGPIMNVNGYLNSNGYTNTTGTFRVNGIVTAITPTALGLSSGGQTWTIGWNSNTMVSAANGAVTTGSGSISIGDTIEVDGTLDSTFSSKINATAIRDLSFH